MAELPGRPVKVVWRRGALTSARRFMAGQAGMRAISLAVAGLASRPEPRVPLSVVPVNVQPDPAQIRFIGLPPGITRRA